MQDQSSHSPLFLSRSAVPTPIPSALPHPPPVASSTSGNFSAPLLISLLLAFKNNRECRVLSHSLCLSRTPTVFINQIDCFPQISLKS
ncbi:hypothetical protein D8674_020884 [Pyrus ussuriensis x Pyrus communis]|uniref:Uncharacterized protein n=1 Tax=Pyrus ussuriensis x Pyrus communis TaxID=2448454 RepID=A0A5N5HGX9_9ROSA|nr:hypothetical protein D8674_020884 [Pyrus ussuriensis x Pyrus communis]